MCMFLCTPVDCRRCDRGLWQKIGHHKPRRAQRILHPRHQKSRSLTLDMLVINTTSAHLCTSYSRLLCPVSVRGSGASSPQWGVPAWLLCQRWLHHLVPEKGDMEDTFVLQHWPLRGLPLPAGDSSSSTSQMDKSNGFGLHPKCLPTLCVFSSCRATWTVSSCSQVQRRVLHRSSRWRSYLLCSISLWDGWSSPQCETQWCIAEQWIYCWMSCLI